MMTSDRRYSDGGARAATWLRRIALIATALGAVSLLVDLGGGLSGHALGRVVGQSGALAFLAFIAIDIAWTVSMLPGVAPTLAAGAVFGPVAGSVLAIVGAQLGATVAFAIARRLGRARIQRLVRRRGGSIDRWIAANGFTTLLYARLVPIVPFNVLNYASGLSSITLRSYCIATGIGIVPGTVVYAAIGSSAGHPGSTAFAVSVGALVLLTVVVGVLARRRRRLAAMSASPSPV